METLNTVLLAVIALSAVVIAVEIRSIGRQIGQGPDLPWLAPIRDGVVDGDIPSISKASTLLSKIEFAGCALAYLVQMQSQRNERSADDGGQ